MNIIFWTILAKHSFLQHPFIIFFRFDDNASQSSGDSILIGVEDQKEFKEYKDRLQVQKL